MMRSKHVGRTGYVSWVRVKLSRETRRQEELALPIVERALHNVTPITRLPLDNTAIHPVSGKLVQAL